MQETSMKALLRLLEEAPVVVDERPIAGFEKWSIPADLKGFAMGDDKHFPAGDAWLRLGFPGIASKAREYSHPRMQAIARVYDAMTDFVRRHAEEARRQNRAELAANLDALTQGAPQTFAQALQALYLLWRVRSVGMTASIGRLDQALYPIYCREKQAGTLTDERALELICALWEKLNGTASGDTLVNVMTGGRDAQGNDQSNELSVLMLRASRLVAKTEPHINARIHPGSSAAYLEELEALHQTGSGQGTMYFDENVIPKLIEAGLPPELAAKYTNDGCTEILIDGEGKIFFTYPEAVKALELTLLRGGVRILPGETVGRYWTHTETPRVWKSSSQPGFDSGAYEESYEALEAAYLRQYGYQLRRQFDKLMERKRGMDADPQTNALLNGTFMQVLETGLDAHEALPATVWMMFSGSLIGAALGAIVWAIVLNIGYVASVVGLLIGWLAEKGYNLLHGKQGKAKIAVLIIAIIFGVLLGTFAADAFTLAGWINDGELSGYGYGDIPWLIGFLLESNSEYRSGTLGNIAMGLLFAALGVFSLLRNAGKEVAGVKYIDLK